MPKNARLCRAFFVFDTMLPGKYSVDIESPRGLLKMAIFMLNYLKNVRAELKHVSWPSYTQTAVYTAVVIGISLAVAVYLGVLDEVFSIILGRIV